MTKLTYLLLGAALTVVGNTTVNTIRNSADFAPGSNIMTGDQYFVTSENPNPTINVDANPVMQFQSGSTNVWLKQNTRIIASGSTINLFGALTLTEVNGYSSGALAITNPLNDPILCEAPVFDVTTASNPNTRIDVYGGTGSIGTMGLNRSGSLVLQDNMGLGAGVMTLSGTGLFDTGGKGKLYKLFPTSNTSQVNRINIVSDAQSGASLVGTYLVRCHIDG